MALTGNTPSKAASKAARAAARQPLTSAAILNNETIMARLRALGQGPQALQSGLSGFVNGGPLAAAGEASIASAQTPMMAIPASTGPAGALATQSAGSLVPVSSMAQSAAGQAIPTIAGEGINLGAHALSAEQIAASRGATAPQALTGIKGFMARQPATIFGRAAIPAAEGAGPWARAFGPGTIGRAAGYAGAGYLGAGLLHSIVGEKDGTWDDAAEGAMKGAGVMAGVGSMIFPGVGTAVLGALGGLGGGIWGAVTGDDSPGKQRDDYLKQQLDATRDGSLMNLVSKYNLAPETRKQLLMELDAVRPSLNSKADAKAVVQQIMGNMPSIVQQDEANRVQASRAAAMQAFMMPMLQRQADDARGTSQYAFTMMNAAADKLSDPTLQAIYRDHAARMLQTNQQASQAMLTQVAVAPQLYAQQQQYGLPNPLDPTGSAYAAAAQTTSGYSPVG